MAAASNPRETAVALARQFASTPFADRIACCEAALSMSPCGLSPAQLKALVWGATLHGFGQVTREAVR
jgi:hypothetical protein